ncbi:MAG: toprim domain-containing protein [Nitrososphaeraceae archaeon]|jgi:5S rRNA maturation endonuclease (ribonuclease M5)
MGYRFIDNTTIDGLHEFIDMLNEEAECGSVIVVEGKRDVEALNRIGFKGNLTILNHFKGITDFVDNHCQIRKKIILLLDMDRTGKHLTSKLVSQLQHKGNNVNLFYKKALAKTTNGKIRQVEELAAYAPNLSGVTGTRRDLYFYI